MAGNMLIHDTRLEGGTPKGIASNNYIVDGTTSIYHIFEWADYYATTQKGLDALYINCHGNSGYLQLGDKGVNMNSANLFAIFAGDVAHIALMACLVAAGDAGKAFCSRVSQLSRATVAAFDAEQLYSYFSWPFGLGNSAIDWGGQEGNCWIFKPDGSYAIFELK